MPPVPFGARSPLSCREHPEQGVIRGETLISSHDVFGSGEKVERTRAHLSWSCTIGPAQRSGVSGAVDANLMATQNAFVATGEPMKRIGCGA